MDKGKVSDQETSLVYQVGFVLSVLIAKTALCALAAIVIDAETGEVA